ncbi:MAG: methyltransferase domain-containing protein [Acidobacteriia bacterium]|nr:methyltransferase domain-containing protein [Terriglobia bacterium]
MPRNWQEHFSDESALDFTPVPLLVQVAEAIAPGDALELAAGAGRNALYLAKLGWRVTAVDNCAAAVNILRKRALEAQLSIHAQLADLEAGTFSIQPAAYDLICDFFYLQRNLFSHIREGVRPGGLFVAKIHLRDANPHNFVLEPGELREEFSSWKILYYSETYKPAPSRPSAAIIARRA